MLTVYNLPTKDDPKSLQWDFNLPPKKGGFVNHLKHLS
jgi:hypothetical protein